MQNSNSTKTTENLSKVIKIDEVQIRDHLGEMVRSTVEQTLNDMLDAEADQLCGAGRYERTETRTDGRAGRYKRKLHTKAGEVELKMPKLRKATFETAIIERYKRRESSVEEALMEMYGTLLQKRFLRCAAWKDERGRGDAKGDPCSGRSRRSNKESRGCSGQA